MPVREFTCVLWTNEAVSGSRAVCCGPPGSKPVIAW